MEEIGNIIYQRRMEMGLTLEEVGKAVGVGKSTVRKWEKGMIKKAKNALYGGAHEDSEMDMAAQ